ncbi:hypothetical protein LCGC14_2295290, partial [marine sediment metagenome]
MCQFATNPLRLAVALLWAAWLGAPSGVARAASDDGEPKVRREQVFEFAQKPTVTRSGDRVEIRFEAKGLCDATLAIEDETARIVRHLASGVLGPNAPEPFRKNSKKQTIVWDGKDDRGKHVDEKDKLSVRVSLGLRPRFEKTLLWEPRKRQSRISPIIRATKEGVCVLNEGPLADLLQLFDHQGNYLRTLHPFPADKVNKVKGLAWHT